MSEQNAKDFVDICNVLREQNIINENGEGKFTRKQFYEAWETVLKHRSLQEEFKKE